MSRYKVTLKPLDWFFFGGEQSFGNEENQSFIARSRRYPQQTSILGMVRYQLLKQNGLLLTGNKEWDSRRTAERDNLIGKDSFYIESTKKQSFGAILSISPVFIQENNQQLMPMPLSHGMNFSRETEYIWMNGTKYENMVTSVSPIGNLYDNYGKLIAENNSLKKINATNLDDADGLILSTMQIGITKAESGDDNLKGFYKQETLRFKNPDTLFVFYLELEEGYKLEDGIVYMGAERSCFHMHVERSEESIFIPEHPSGSILLLSPTYIDDRSVLDRYSFFQLSNTISFRSLRTVVDTDSETGKIRYHRNASLYTFLTAGSVIFYQDETQLAKLKELLDKGNLQTIGYNKYSVK